MRDETRNWIETPHEKVRHICIKCRTNETLDHRSKWCNECEAAAPLRICSDCGAEYKSPLKGSGKCLQCFLNDRTKYSVNYRSFIGSWLNATKDHKSLDKKHEIIKGTRLQVLNYGKGVLGIPVLSFVGVAGQYKAGQNGWEKDSGISD